MCGYFSNWFILFYDTFFIDYMIKGKENDKIILKYFNRIKTSKKIENLL